MAPWQKEINMNDVKIWSGFTKQYVEYVLDREITDEMLNDWNESEEAQMCCYGDDLGRPLSVECMHEFIKAWYCCRWTNEGKLMQWHKNEHSRLDDLNASIEEINWHWNEFQRLHKLLIERSKDM